MKEGLFREGLELVELCAQLNDIFGKQQTMAFPDFLRHVAFNLNELKMLAVDNEPFIYLVLNFYLSVFKDSALIFSEIQKDSEACFEDLMSWVLDYAG